MRGTTITLRWFSARSGRAVQLEPEYLQGQEQSGRRQVLFQRRQDSVLFSNNTNQPNKSHCQHHRDDRASPGGDDHSHDRGVGVWAERCFTFCYVGLPARDGRGRRHDEGNALPAAVLHRVVADAGDHFLQLFLPQNTFGDDVKPFKEYNLTVLTIAPIFLAIWTASHSIADEIEGKTALTLLSKPVSRVVVYPGQVPGRHVFPLCCCSASRERFS
jgi:hypothetical protein